MNTVFAVVAFSLLQPTAPEAQQVDVAADEMAAAQNAAAIEHLENSADLDADDPARLMNLGVAYARAGRLDEARAMFEAVIASDTRVRLETVEGEWVDSRRLAYRALAMLDNGQLDNRTRMAAR